jgi:hypothetical protein
MERPKQEKTRAKESKDILVPSEIQGSVPPTKGVINQATLCVLSVCRASDQGREYQRDAGIRGLLVIRTVNNLAVIAFDLFRDSACNMRGQLWNPRSVLNDAINMSLAQSKRAVATSRR